MAKNPQKKLSAVKKLGILRRMNFTFNDIFDKIVIEVASKKYKFA